MSVIVRYCVVCIHVAVANHRKSTIQSNGCIPQLVANDHEKGYAQIAELATHAGPVPELCT